MIRRKEDIVSTLKLSPFQRTVEITVRGILDGPEEPYEKGGVFAHTTVYPGSGIDYHVHDNGSETRYVISGAGTFSDNGKLVEVGPGNVTSTGDGGGHNIEAINGEPIEIIALILYHNVA